MTVALARIAPQQRQRALRRDCSVKRARKLIEETFGLPEGSVRLHLPDKREPRSDTKIARLRERWELAGQSRGA